ncbi:MAG: hypothetical protein OEW18_04590, partial [Candidatus Aminicenantes bacterium]|nr:hypothetical protein [Candidatus Aminicenantes bacterium]
ENGERTPAFFAGAAIAGLRADRAEPLSPTISTAPRFSLSQVHLLAKIPSRNSQMPELPPVETYGAFLGLKITLKIKGGWNIFSGGDIEKGIGGMYDNAFQLISATGAPIVENQKAPNHAGLEVGGDLIYCITPRFGIGIGASRINAGKESLIIYHVTGSTDDELRIRPEIKVTSLRLGLFYAFPFAGRLAISVHGGPAFYFAKYIYNLSMTSGSPGLEVVLRGFLPTGLYQETSAKQLGLEGGVGFEFNANRFVAFFVEAMGRYAKIGSFKGKEETSAYQNFHPQVFNQTGSLYYVDTDQYPLLDIVPSEGAAAGNVRKATLNFSGFSFLAGLKLRF